MKTPQRTTQVEDTRFQAFLRYLQEVPPYLRAEALEFYRAYARVEHEVVRAA